jgi:hypothetical protein
MSFLSKVGDFLFGKQADIFDDKGRVFHKLSKKKWDNWNDRIVKGKEYNWRDHKGKEAGLDQNTKPKN